MKILWLIAGLSQVYFLRICKAHGGYIRSALCAHEKSNREFDAWLWEWLHVPILRIELVDFTGPEDIDQETSILWILSRAFTLRYFILIFKLPAVSLPHC